MGPLAIGVAEIGFVVIRHANVDMPHRATTGAPREALAQVGQEPDIDVARFEQQPEGAGAGTEQQHNDADHQRTAFFHCTFCAPNRKRSRPASSARFITVKYIGR